MVLAMLLSWLPRSQALSSITNAVDVLALTAAEAAEARPVSLRAVVIDQVDPRGRALLVADRSGGVYLLAAGNSLSGFQQGDLLDIAGVTDPGEFAPIVKSSAVQKLGTAPLPAPLRATYHELISGALDAQFIELFGVVQRVMPPEGADRARFLLSVEAGQVHVRVPGPLQADVQEDAEVRVRALCFYQFNRKRQMLNPVLQVPAGVPVSIEKPAPADPFSGPLHSVSNLLQFSRGNMLGHRIHVRGVVLHNDHGSTVWIRDASSGLRLRTRSAVPLQAGDLVDVIGFPRFGSAIPVLEDSMFRRLGSSAPPLPIVLASPAEAFERSDDLVAIQGSIKQMMPVTDGLDLLLEANETVFKAVLRLPVLTRTYPEWQPGTLVRVGGICTVIYDEARPLMGMWHPEEFQLLIRSPADVRVLQAPSWWTLAHVTYVLGGCLGATLVAGGATTLVARRRLREQERERRMAETEFAAILAERNRLAREIHDTLAQGLAATSVQLRLARKHLNSVEASGRHLEAAQDLVRGSLEEARKSIWNMRSQALESGGLPGALQQILRQMAEGLEVKTEFKVSGRVRRLAPVVENNLLRVGQEAITNATKHSSAKRIEVVLAYGEKQFRLGVQDDGLGFDTANPHKSGDAFGLVGMRERAGELNGELKIESAPGKGTKVVLTVPLPGD